jgi:hypothetical protein
MKKNVNMLMGYCPFIGYELAEMLLRDHVINKCVLAGWKRAFAGENDHIEFIYSEDQKLVDYSAYVDINTLPALSKSLLEEMLPYESMCIKLGLRNSNFPIDNYETDKISYHMNLRFWNWIFETREINMVYFDEIPHNLMSDYVIYSLARVKNIPVLMAEHPSGVDIRVFGRNFDDLGYEIEDYYLSGKENVITEDQLSGKIGEFYRKKKEAIANNTKEYVDHSSVKFARDRDKNIYFGQYLERRARLKYFVYKGLGKFSDIPADKRKYVENYPKIRRFLRQRAYRIKKYDKMAVLPDYNRKYIVFFPQLTPEASTIPLAGVFAEQYTSIQLIARAAEKNGLPLYVKEHLVQPFRDAKFYELIRSIPNVILIKSTINSYNLIKHSVAVATQTGTCILESAMMGKPVLVTSRGYAWKGLPNVFEVTDENQGAEIIRNLLEGKFSIEQNEVIKYFYAVNQVCIDNSIPDNGWKLSYDAEVKAAEEKRVVKIKEFINKYVC